jgi:predicted dehydrogenase
MDTVRIGIIGYGGMGRGHAAYLDKGEVPGARLTAIMDGFGSSLEAARKNHGEGVQYFSDAQEMMDSGEVDAILIATPHYEHPKLAIQGFKAGLHVLTEKPAGVYTKQVREMNEAAAESGKTFGIMFNQRTRPHHRKMKSIVESGQLGEIQRIQYVITDWFRTQAYYNSGGWRATWKGEGGGVLINQCPHNLDLWQWISGMMPQRIRAFCGFGKFHDIEVEDSVTAYAEYENGATATFIASTGEAPGNNTFEIVGDRGRLVLGRARGGGEALTWYQTQGSVKEFLQNAKGGFDTPEVWTVDIPGGSSPEHKAITINFVAAVRGEAELIAPGEEGIKGLTLSNAMHLSSWTDDWVNLPIDEDKYLRELNKRIKKSVPKEKAAGKALEFGGTF